MYKNGYIEVPFVHKQFGIPVAAVLLEKYAFVQGILSVVIDTGDKLIAYLRDKFQRFAPLGEHVVLPIKVEYGTSKTLDGDRLAAAVGVNYLQSGKGLLVIDAGTATMYEVIEAPGTFLGGNISPGMTTHSRALSHFTKKLPLVTEEDDIPPTGRGMEMTIQVGVADRVVYEMDGYTDELRVKYPDLPVFSADGHSLYFERRLKNSISVDINPVLTGLNRILGYSVKN